LNIHISHLLIFIGQIFAYTLSWNNVDLRGGWSRLCVIHISITATQKCVSLQKLHCQCCVYLDTLLNKLQKVAEIAYTPSIPEKEITSPNHNTWNSKWTFHDIKHFPKRFMNLHITPSFNIDRLCKTATVLLFLVLRRDLVSLFDQFIYKISTHFVKILYYMLSGSL